MSRCCECSAGVAIPIVQPATGRKCELDEGQFRDGELFLFALPSTLDAWHQLQALNGKLCGGAATRPPLGARPAPDLSPALTSLREWPLHQHGVPTSTSAALVERADDVDNFADDGWGGADAVGLAGTRTSTASTPRNFKGLAQARRTRKIGAASLAGDQHGRARPCHDLQQRALGAALGAPPCAACTSTMPRRQVAVRSSSPS